MHKPAACAALLLFLPTSAPAHATAAAGATVGAGQASAVLTLANWTLQQPLAAKPGQQYSYTNDAFWLLTYIIEKVGFP